MSCSKGQMSYSASIMRRKRGAQVKYNHKYIRQYINLRVGDISSTFLGTINRFTFSFFRLSYEIIAFKPHFSLILTDILLLFFFYLLFRIALAERNPSCHVAHVPYGAALLRRA